MNSYLNNAHVYNYSAEYKMEENTESQLCTSSEILDNSKQFSKIIILL